ncbi:ORF6N domain-containing protein [Pedobacter alluvionis]|uniref:ORF6N domain-containing protein n=1 Tax=Pedobacter alluvionis TaxID=475253 RepID=A0A497Y6C5_9SPHI|nr:ORF6N domain-containing protein [Pedobacter alluvionis]RLJ77526.1 ORF6N domain-containing protein [Pedobacter alluvionis]TFB33261.1 ORF6N domain-containing protein [Pedobacter alluvionis]
MKEEISPAIIPNEVIVNKIYLFRGVKVMLDSDLAELFGVDTKRLKEQVRRNIERFPEHFMFELTKEENEVLRSQFVTLEQGKYSKYLPFAFSEHGILQLSNVLKSKQAVEVSIKIIDVFVQLRTMVLSNTEIRLEVEKIKKKVDNQDKNIEVIFRYFDELLEQKAQPRKEIGYKISKEK